MKKNWFFRILIVVGIIIFAVLAFIIVRSTATLTAVVPNQYIAAGTTLNNSMLKEIAVPVDTPKGYITDMNSLVGQKIKSSVDEDQLLYANNFMSSWDDYSEGKAIPADYVITAIQIPNERAVGGLITAGDYVDILGIPKEGYRDVEKEQMKDYLGAVADHSYGTEKGINLYWVLSNVFILETNSTLSKADQSSVSTVIGDGGSGSFYIVALSYSDYQKLRLCELYMDYWMNICPEQNMDNGPMFEEMLYSKITGLMDAQKQSKLAKEDENKKNDSNTEDDASSIEENTSSSNSTTENSTTSDSEESGVDKSKFNISYDEGTKMYSYTDASGKLITSDDKNYIYDHIDDDGNII